MQNPPPPRVLDLAVQAPEAGAMILTWTAVAADDRSSPFATYDVRYSTSTIDDSSWAAATPVPDEPVPQYGGATETMTGHGPVTRHDLLLRAEGGGRSSELERAVERRQRDDPATARHVSTVCREHPCGSAGPPPLPWT